VLVVFAGSIVYNIYDNQRFIVVQQKTAIDRLPESFDGFKILQISDLLGNDLWYPNFV
jgi:predicted MPP superfamily phosphohydrolase